MKLWILRPRKLKGNMNLWDPWYDKAFGFVIRATSEVSARDWASKNAGDELNAGDNGPRAWLDSMFSTCIELTSQGDEEIILKDFAGA